MFFVHPILFWKYSIKRKSRLFFVNGSSRFIRTKSLNPGSNVRLGDRNRIISFSDSRLIIGNDCYIVNNNTFLIGEVIKIGNNVTIASDVLVTSENHEAKPECDEVYGSLEMKPVSIGNNCWIAEKAVILPGVTIGDYCVIGAGAIVTHDVPSYTVAVGNPAKAIKRYDLKAHRWISI